MKQLTACLDAQHPPTIYTPPPRARASEIRNRTPTRRRDLLHPARGRSAPSLAPPSPSSMASPPLPPPPPPPPPPYYEHEDWSPSYSPAPMLFGAASLGIPSSPPSSPGSLASSPGPWWPLPSPISTLDAPLTPSSPVYNPYTPPSWSLYSPGTPTYYPSNDSLISPSFSPDYTPGLPTAYPPTSHNNCPPEEFNHRDYANPAPVPPLTTCYNSTSQIYGNSSTAYSATAPGCFPAGSSGGNRTSPVLRERPVLQLPSPPILRPWSADYSPVTPRYSPVEPRADWGNPSRAHGAGSTSRLFCHCCLMPVEDCCCNKDSSPAHGVATSRLFCHCCLMPVEDCCCNKDSSQAHGVATSRLFCYCCLMPVEDCCCDEEASLGPGVDTAPEYCYCCSTLVEGCSCMAGGDAPALPPLPPPA
ncbi:unnamed protein product [Urochloa humidicola]